jgi:hypothetical protein
VSALYQDSIDRIRAPLVEDPRYRDQKRNWAAATETTYSGVNVQPQQVPVDSDEYTEDRQTTVTRYQVTSRRGVDLDVLETDRVRYAGMVCEVVGKVGRWPRPGGGVHHVEFLIKEID